ncbi:MAG: ferritin family protein [Phycisphaerales bacterium]
MTRTLPILFSAAAFSLCAGSALAQGPAKQPASPSTAPVTAPAAQPKTSEKTVEALRATYWTAKHVGEFYTKAAAKAETDGAPGVASLFRAAAKVESVHEANVKRELEALKSDAGAARTAPSGLDIKTTKENAGTATKLATTARETDLPAARKTAEADGQRDAARVFREAREGEIELVRLFKDAAELGADWKKGKRDFFVGRTCGYVVEKLDLTKCPVCGKGRDDFEKVN